VKKTWTNELVDYEQTEHEAKNRKKVSNYEKKEDKLKTSKVKEVKISNTADPHHLATEDNSSDEELEHNPKEKTEDHAKSDLDWLSSKVSKNVDEDQRIASDEDEEGNQTGNDEESSNEDETDSSSESEEELEAKVKTLVTNEALSLTIKMRGVPFSCTEKQIIDFFNPIKVLDIRIPFNEKGKAKGNAYVDFETEGDAEEAMARNRGKIKKRYIELFRLKEADQSKMEEKSPWELKQVSANDDDEEPVAESGRLFLRNLAYTCTEDEVKDLFEKYGPIAEIHLPIDKTTKRITGIGFVTFVMPEHAVKAFNDLDGKSFQGRLLHIMPAKAKKTAEDVSTIEGAGSSYKKEKDAKMKSLSSSGHNWNTLFLGQNAVVDALAERMNTNKSKILEAEASESLAVRMALGETQLVAETREFLISNGVRLDVFGQVNAKRSNEVILVKNLPHGTKPIELRNIFGKFGDLEKILLPPSGITAIIHFSHPTEARSAFKGLAFSKFKHVPLYLEWAPSDIFEYKHETEKPKSEEETHEEKEKEEDEDNTDENSGKVIFVKNLNFGTTEESIKNMFEKCGKVASVTIARKKDPKKPGSLLSMGYGFVEFKRKGSADEAIKTLQHKMLDDHQLELKKSHRKELSSDTSRKRAIVKKQRTSKILVRNVPFEATRKEIKQLFGAFGELKTVRLPQKLAGSGSHRGFAFVDYLSKQDAKRAFKSLCQSTHLYGRRLVLEWAEDDDTVESIRQKTALHFSDEPAKKKSKRDIIDTLDKAVPSDSL